MYWMLFNLVYTGVSSYDGPLALSELYHLFLHDPSTNRFSAERIDRWDKVCYLCQASQSMTHELEVIQRHHV